MTGMAIPILSLVVVLEVLNCIYALFDKNKAF